MGRSLFDIDADIRAFIDHLYAVTDEDGTIPDADFEQLEALNAERDKKVDNIALYYKELLADAEALKAESDKLAKRAKIAKNKAERLKDYLDRTMDGHPFESSRNKIGWINRKDQLELDEKLLPKKYFIKKFEFKPDKDRIKEVLKSGTKIKGAELKEKKYIQIK